MADEPFDPRLVEAGRAARLVAAACGATLAQADAAQSAAVERLRWALLAERWSGSDRARALAESEHHAGHLARLAARLGCTFGGQ
jgi:N-acetylmuramic acid 6-phosphate (MurNAc-6-P) etherase